MRKFIYLMLPFAAWLSASVNAQTVPNLSIADQSRLSRDLAPTPQDFFKRGQEQLEREIRWLERRSTQPDDLLKIEPALRASGTGSRDPEHSAQEHRSAPLKPITLRK